MKKKQFLWLMIAIGILSTGSGCDSVKPVSTTQEIPTAEETNLVTTVPISEGEQPAETNRSANRRRSDDRSNNPHDNRRRI